ncbi:MAG: ATPase, T2SS/T4P/T4SS family [Candidatus Hodarchaeota archaeon]
MDSIFIIDEYPVPPYVIRIIDISQTESLEKFYLPSLAQNKDINLVVINKLKQETIRRLKAQQKIPQILKLRELVIELDHLIEKTVEELAITLDSRILRVIRYQILGFSKILPFLLDEYIEEIYLDNLRTPIYVDHAHWGRCRTNIYLSKEDIHRLITRARIEGNAPLNRANPSLKTDLVSQDFIARVSIDIAPLAIDGIHLDIRKLSKRPRTLQSLIQNQTLPPLAAAYLIFLLLHRCNIAIIGEPGSGKTTLMNALDMLTPHHWRKITIEDVVESIDQSELGFHQVRLKVDPIEKERKTSTKSLEIVKLLHRSPDWVYFGEIQTQEQTTALFHALTTGLKGIFSYHATTPKHLVIRSIAHYQVPPISLQAIDIIVQMKKTWNSNKLRRQVYKISEIGDLSTSNLDLHASQIEVRDIFRYNPQISQLEQVANLFATPALKGIKKEVFIEEESFNNKLKIISSVLSPPYQNYSETQKFHNKKNITHHLSEIVHTSGGNTINIKKERRVET